MRVIQVVHGWKEGEGRQGEGGRKGGREGGEGGREGGRHGGRHEPTDIEPSPRASDPGCPWLELEVAKTNNM